MKNILTLGSRIDWCIKDNSTPDIKRLLQKVAIHRISLVYVYSTGADGSCPTIYDIPIFKIRKDHGVIHIKASFICKVWTYLG